MCSDSTPQIHWILGPLGANFERLNPGCHSQYIGCAVKRNVVNASGQLRTRWTMENVIIILVFLVNACLVGAGVYLSSYLKNKAKGLATKEDFKDLKEQTAELTRITKGIEAKVSIDVWDYQKRWETRKEVIFESMRNMGKAQSMINETLAALLIYESAGTQADKDASAEVAKKCVERCRRNVTDLAQSHILISLAAGMPVIDAYVAASNGFSSVIDHLKDAEQRRQRYLEFSRAIGHLEGAVRKELRLDV